MVRSLMIQLQWGWGLGFEHCLYQEYSTLFCRWMAPEDENALTVDSEFLVGDDILVAPVLEKGAMSRDIYLPTGRWHSQIRPEVLEGRMWHKGYPVKLDELQWFTRVEENKPQEKMEV